LCLQPLTKNQLNFRASQGTSNNTKAIERVCRNFIFGVTFILSKELP